MLVSLYLVQVKYIEIHQQESLFTGWNVLEVFCVPLYTDYMSDLHKKLKVLFTCGKNVEYEILSGCCILFLCYSNTSHADSHRHTH